MGMFTVKSSFVYLQSTGAQFAAGDSDAVLDDMEMDTSFEIGDTFSIFISPVNVSASYVGTAMIDGELVPVLESNDPLVLFAAGGPVYVFASSRDEADIMAPTTFGASDITATNFTAVCFLPGTGIATETGEVAVESLKIGDGILTPEGRSVAVKWIGRQTLTTRFGPAAKRRPVRIAAGALGGGLPERDLCVTADHGLLLDDVLVNAGALIGAAGIREMTPAELGEQFTVYHIETEGHAVILAENTPSETFVDYASRRQFDNHAEYLALYGEDDTTREAALPRVTSAKHLPDAVKARLGLTARSKVA